MGASGNQKSGHDLSKKIGRFPHVGLRIVKSAVAVALCFLISFFRKNEGIVFYSQLAALWCIQTYVADTKKNAIQRTLGTVIGAVYGLLVLLLQQFINSRWEYSQLLHATVVSLMIIAVLQTTVLIHKKQASYFSCVVFLSIVINHIGEANPYIFVWNRFLDTMIGIVVGVSVNSFSLPRKKRKDVLFVSGLDDILFDEQEQISDYCRAELNRMLDEGIQFTISTVRTPAVIAELMNGIRLKLPVIAMDGAVLFDIANRGYKKVYVISAGMSEKIMDFFNRHHIFCFVNVIVDDTLVIYFGENIGAQQRQLMEKLRRSPYRNYVNRPLPKGEEVVYFLVYDETPIVEDISACLKKEGFDEHLKIISYASVENQGYSYLKIFNKNANKNNMIAYLKQETGMEQVVTFGSIPEKYDVVVEIGDVNKVVHILKRLYEPIFIGGITRKI